MTTKGYEHSHSAQLPIANTEGPNPGWNLCFVLYKNNFDTQIHQEDFYFFFIVCLNRKGEQWEKKWEGAELKLMSNCSTKTFHYTCKKTTCILRDKVGISLDRKQQHKHHNCGSLVMLKERDFWKQNSKDFSESRAGRKKSCVRPAQAKITINKTVFKTMHAETHCSEVKTGCHIFLRLKREYCGGEKKKKRCNIFLKGPSLTYVLVYNLKLPIWGRYA